MSAGFFVRTASHWLVNEAATWSCSDGSAPPPSPCRFPPIGNFATARSHRSFANQGCPRKSSKRTDQSPRISIPHHPRRSIFKSTPSAGFVDTAARTGFSAFTALKRKSFTNAPTTSSTSSCPRCLAGQNRGPWPKPKWSRSLLRRFRARPAAPSVTPQRSARHR